MYFVLYFFYQLLSFCARRQDVVFPILGFVTVRRIVLMVRMKRCVKITHAAFCSFDALRCIDAFICKEKNHSDKSCCIILNLGNIGQLIIESFAGVGFAMAIMTVKMAPMKRIAPPPHSDLPHPLQYGLSFHHLKRPSIWKHLFLRIFYFKRLKRHHLLVLCITIILWKKKKLHRKWFLSSSYSQVCGWHASTHKEGNKDLIIKEYKEDEIICSLSCLLFFVI